MSRELPKLDRKGLRNFSWMFSGMVAILFGVILPWFLKQGWLWEPWVIAAAFFAWGLIAPSSVEPFYRLWMRFGSVMNFITTRIILGAVFFLVVFPFGLVFRLRGRDLLHRKWDDELQSYRVKSSVVSSTDMEKPF